MGQLIKTGTQDLFGDGNTGQYLYSADILDGESDVVKIPPSGRVQSIGVAMLVCGDGVGRIDFTIDTHEMIDAGTAVWEPWDKGIVSGTQVDTFRIKMTGLRGVSISGTITFKLSI
jgi:hypothetical protein